MMAEPFFTPNVRQALDAYTVPPVPQGFADGLMSRIADGDTGVETTSLAIPSGSPRRSSPWRRSSRILGSLAFLSLATATAAAAGIFGKPVYVPGVSEALVKAKIVEGPKLKLPPKIRMVADSDPTRAPVISQPELPGSAAIVESVTELRNDPEFAKLPPRQRIIAASREVREMVRTGQVNQQDVRAAVRELVQNTDPATKEAWRAVATERRTARRERMLERGAVLQPDPQASTPSLFDGAEGATAEAELPRVEADQQSPEAVVAQRERLRTTTVEQRADLRAALRERRQLRLQRAGQ